MKEKERSKADLHGHTWWSGELMSWYGVNAALERALAVGLDWLAITEHSGFLSWLALRTNIVGRTLRRREDNGLQSPKVILGQEVTTKDGNTFPHILVLGHDPYAESIKGVPALKSIEETIQWAHDLGLLAIAAHPTPEATFASLSYQRVLEIAEKMERSWDGVEGTSLRRGKDVLALELARKLGVPPFGGSDFHWKIEIGRAGIYLPQEARLYNSEQLIDFFRKKPFLESFINEESLPPSRNIMLWFRNLVNKRNGR